ncbi:MAG: FkbM family methyltransferase [Proteobacteria bacterium]|nr:FkbM family methyltransferase [Pseudomonadota bacterium]
MYTTFHGDCGLDKWIADHFMVNDHLENGVIIDIGAYHPTYLNISYFFEKNGWDTYCIEANPYMITELNKVRKNVIPYAVSNVCEDDCDFIVVKGNFDEFGQGGGTGFHSDVNRTDAVSEIVKVKKVTLDHLLATEIKVNKIDVVTIDVEGHENSVLDGFDLERWRPKLMVIENFIEPTWRSRRIRSRLKSAGYELAERIQVNDCFIRVD